MQLWGSSLKKKKLSLLWDLHYPATPRSPTLFYIPVSGTFNSCVLVGLWGKIGECHLEEKDRQKWWGFQLLISIGESLKESTQPHRTEWKRNPLFLGRKWDLCSKREYSFYFQFSTKWSFLTLFSISKALVLRNKNLGVKILNYFPFNKPSFPTWVGTETELCLCPTVLH